MRTVTVIIAYPDGRSIIGRATYSTPIDLPVMEWSGPRDLIDGAPFDEHEAWAYAARTGGKVEATYVGNYDGGSPDDLLP